LDSLLNGLDAHIFGRVIVLELTFALGFYGLFNQILRNHSITNIVLFLKGKAHRGKTRALMLSAFTWTHPDYVSSDLATEAGIYDCVEDNGIIPMIADDVLFKSKSLRRVIKAFSDGRGVKTGRTSRIRHFHSLFLSGNKSGLRLGNVGDNDGYASRIFELEFDSYADNKEHADAISEFANTCYGVSGDIVLSYIANIPDLEASVENVYRNWLNIVRCSNSDVNSRQQDMIALTLTTAQFVGEALGREFRLDLIRETLADSSIKAYRQSESTNSKAEAHNIVLFLRQLLIDNPINKNYERGNPESLNKFSKKIRYALDSGTFCGNSYLGYASEDVLFIRGEHFAEHTFRGNCGKKVKELLIDNGFLIVGDHNSGFDTRPRGNGITHIMKESFAKGKTFYAFCITRLLDENFIF